ncbi:MAG: hypothetical protein KAG99_05120, partial [Bacteroidales bacterium]|nr:hypothetical protein [Bacteroidales bacterium]
MNFDQAAIQSISIIVILILGGMGFRKLGVLKEEDGGLFARMITQYTLPALIFHALSTSDFDTSKLQLAGVMI